MEYEVRFYFNSEKYKSLCEELSKVEGLVKSPRTYEKTSQYNHSDPRYDFYSKDVDGRFRIRVSKNDEKDSCKLSWKQRVKDFNQDAVNKEIEKEVHFDYKDLEDAEFLLDTILHFRLVESYERYRTTFSNDDVEIALDEYPFGVALEIENKSTTKNPQENVLEYVKLLGLDLNDSFKLSWDDKYRELCNAQGIQCYSDVTFDKPMPHIS